MQPKNDELTDRTLEVLSLIPDYRGKPVSELGGDTRSHRYHCNKLLRLGLIARRRSLLDGRTRLYFLTEKGLAFKQKELS